MPPRARATSKKNESEVFEDLDQAPEEHLTHFDEDDDPLLHVGDDVESDIEDDFQTSDPIEED